MKFPFANRAEKSKSPTINLTNEPIAAPSEEVISEAVEAEAEIEVVAPVAVEDAVIETEQDEINVSKFDKLTAKEIESALYSITDDVELANKLMPRHVRLLIAHELKKLDTDGIDQLVNLKHICANSSRASLDEVFNKEILAKAVQSLRAKDYVTLSWMAPLLNKEGAHFAPYVAETVETLVTRRQLDRVNSIILNLKEAPQALNNIATANVLKGLQYIVKTHDAKKAAGELLTESDFKDYRSIVEAFKDRPMIQGKANAISDYVMRGNVNAFVEMKHDMADVTSFSKLDEQVYIFTHKEREGVSMLFNSKSGVFTAQSPTMPSAITSFNQGRQTWNSAESKEDLREIELALLRIARNDKVPEGWEGKRTPPSVAVIADRELKGDQGTRTPSSATPNTSFTRKRYFLDPFEIT